VLDERYHFSSQLKSVLIATFKAFCVWKSFTKRMQLLDDKNKFTVKEFFKSIYIKYDIEYHGWSMGLNFSILQHWILKKSCSAISFKIFCALSREKKWKNRKSNFLYCLNKADLNLRRWTQCSSHSERKLSNEELMQTDEEFGLDIWDPEKHCYNKEALYWIGLRHFTVKPL